MAKTSLSLYEFYVLGINQLLKNSPWQREKQITAFKNTFMYEQRLISLVILSLLGEEYVPESALRTMPSMREKAKASINQAVFLRALKYHYRDFPEATGIAERALLKMDSYIVATRYAHAQGVDPLAGIMDVLLRRVPARTQEEQALYSTRIRKILTYTQALVEQSLSTKFTIADS